MSQALASIDEIGQGENCKVSLVEGVLIIDKGGITNIITWLWRLRKEGPDLLLAAFSGPSKSILLDALKNDIELLKAVLESLRENGALPPDTQLHNKTAKELLALFIDVLRHNKGSVIAALRKNKALLVRWGTNHRQLLGILFEGDIRVYLDEIANPTLKPHRTAHQFSIELTEVNEKPTVKVEESELPNFSVFVGKLKLLAA